MLQELFKKYRDEICSTCKGKCEKGICILQSSILEVKCVDYVRDEMKIKKPPDEPKIKAKRHKPVMRAM